MSIEPVTVGSDETALQKEIRRIVETLYGPPIRRLPGMEIGRSYRGANNDSQFGGDVVALFRDAHGCTSLAVVDITGHGIRAAAHAGLVKHALRAYTSGGFDALESVQALNQLFIDNAVFDDEEQTFATLFFAVIAPDCRSMHYVSAGIESMYLVRSAVGYKLGATGPIIGLMNDPSAFRQAEAALMDGDVIAAVTDGFAEARNENCEFLGGKAIVDVILANAALDAEQQAEALTNIAYEHSGRHLHDDVGALVVKIQAVHISESREPARAPSQARRFDVTE